MKTVFIAAMMAFSASVYASECAVTIHRDACPGQQSESFKKCNGQNPCALPAVEKATVQECTAYALENCINTADRRTVTQYKTVTATFNRQSVESGKDFCDKNSGTYVVATNFPFRGRPDCR